MVDKVAEVELGVLHEAPDVETVGVLLHKGAPLAGVESQHVAALGGGRVHGAPAGLIFVRIHYFGRAVSFNVCLRQSVLEHCSWSVHPLTSLHFLLQGICSLHCCSSYDAIDARIRGSRSAGEAAHTEASVSQLLWCDLM